MTPTSISGSCLAPLQGGVEFPSEAPGSASIDRVH